MQNKLDPLYTKIRLCKYILYLVENLVSYSLKNMLHT